MRVEINLTEEVAKAIKEKLQRDWKSIKEQRNKEYCPF